MIPLRIVLASLACLCPFSLAQEPKSDPDKTLIIISTSDIHGNLDNFPRLATLVKQYRAKYPHVLLVDSGDYFIGNPYVDDCEKRGEPLTILMNKLGYDVVTIGNHDLDYGQEALRDHIKGMPSTKFVITNASLSPTLENCFSPYVSIPIKGTSISVGVIGLADLQTTDVRRMAGISWTLPDEEHYKGITDRFRLHHNTINVILSHLGYGNDLKMMKYSPNIDVILGGHTHVMLPSGHLRTGTLLSHTGHSLSHVGVTEIIFSTEKPVSVLSKSTRAVSLNEEIPNDPEVKEIVRRFSGNPLFNQQVGVAGEEITHVTIGTLFCKAIQQASHSDIAIYNRGGVRSKNHLNKGPVTIRDIYELEPFREKIVTCSMSKADIEQLILSKFMSPTDDEGGILEVYCSGFSYQIMDGVTPSITSTLKAVSLNEEIPNDPEVKEIVRRFSGNPLFNQQVGVAGEEITHVTIGTLFCKAIQQASHSDIAIYNRGGVRSKNHLNKGPVTIRDIYELEPFREKIVTCSMSKADIEQLILSKFMSPTDDEGGILEVYCSGFSYQIMDGVTPSITSTLKNGVIYTVAMGDYLCSNFIFPQRGNGKPTGIDVRKALIDYLKQIKKLLNPPPSKLPIIRDTTFAL